jgi:tetratricopeptide (TPR) repeat protein
MGPPTWAENVSAPDPAHPWEKDQALLETVNVAYNSGGIMIMQTYAIQLERALAGAKTSYVLDEPKGKVSYKLTDGRADTLDALLSGAIDPSNTEVEVVAVKNPYPAMSLYLGLYYDEIGRPTDALRVINRSLSLLTETGEHRPALIAERGAALAELKQWPDVLKDFEEGLKLRRLDKSMTARMYRGKGMALTELGRLDEAEAAYKESLTDEPGNTRALNELTYIARLRAGAVPTSPALIPLQNPPAAPADSLH